MFKRLIIITAGAGFAIYCIVIAFLTLFGKNLATLHLTKLFQIGYAAISAALTPFGIAGVIGGFSRKKALIRAFVTFQWWLSTFVVIGLNVFNIILAKRNKGDFIRRCQNDLAKGQPESEFLTRCTAIVNDAEKATFIAACIQGGIMLFLGIVLLIVGMREYGSISLEEETKNLIGKANLDETDDKMDKIENLGDRLSPKTSNPNINGGGIIDTLAPGRYPPTNMTNVIRQPTNLIKPVTTNVDLTRRPTNEITINPLQNSGLRRNPTDLRNQTLMPQLYKDLTRNPTIPVNVPPKRYPTNGSTNVTRQPTIGNTYASRNYGAPGAPQAAYPTAPKRYLPTEQYVNPSPSYVTQFIIPPPQPSLMNKEMIEEIIVSEANGYNTDYKDYSDYSDYSDFNNDDNDNYVRKPYTYNSPTKTMAPYLTRMGMK